MQLSGKNIIAGRPSAQGTQTFSGVNPVDQGALDPIFHEATASEVESAAWSAADSHEKFERQPPERIAAFLDRIADEILALGDELIQRARLETALPEPRLTGERTRTINQVRMFAELVRDGSWVEASIDRALPDRKPVPKPDLRRKLVSIGPVAVFGASNFPFAYSVAGGDTASAFAAGNPVIVKAHPAHPGTSELMAVAVQRAAETTGMPAGIFSMLHGVSHNVGLQLARHPAIKAVGFTGSVQAGRALFDAAAARAEPIPVYAEMGSTNPVFILPGALKRNAAGIAEGFFQSLTLGVGQFCTNPGLVFGVNDASLDAFVEKAAQLTNAAPPATMLYQGICDRFKGGVEQVSKVPGVIIAGKSTAAPGPGQAPSLIFLTDIKTFSNYGQLQQELFGPASLIVRCPTAADLERAARELPGQLTATIHGTEQDLEQHRDLAWLLQRKVGRLIFNGFPTGVEVCPSMHHGGPYPATTDSHFSAVGCLAVRRFARPVCFQNFPPAALPLELQNKNVRNIWRTVDGKLSKEDLE